MRDTKHRMSARLAANCGALPTVSARALWSVGWSSSFLLVTRVSSVLAVPLVLHSLGSALYGVWVMAGAVIMIQGLFDLGVSAALVRFVAVAAARGSRSTVLIVVRRALVFYLALSIVVCTPLLLWAQPVASLFPSVPDAAQGDAAVLLRYCAIAFALTNATLVFGSLLQGLGRVDASYRGQTLGWLLYFPALIIGIQAGGGADAVGLAWVSSYVVQLVLLSASAWSALGDLSHKELPAPSFAEMLSLGGWWQLSSWADFATIQLPRLVGGFVLLPSDLVAVDVALRAAQLVVSPLSAVYPLVLPAAAKEWSIRGREGLKIFLERWFTPTAIALWLLTMMFIPVEQTALVAWTGRPSQTFHTWLNVCVLIGIAAHSSTGVFSSSRLASGDISSVLRFKKNQLILGLVLVPLSLFGGVLAVGVALAVALAIPALAFDWAEAMAFDLRRPPRQSHLLLRVTTSTVVGLAALSTAAWLLEGAISPWLLATILLLLWAGACCSAWVWCCRSLTQHHASHSARHAPGAQEVAS
jgi:O-antigen/teichoic acid export membrane protein